MLCKRKKNTSLQDLRGSYETQCKTKLDIKTKTNVHTSLKTQSLGEFKVNTELNLHKTQSPQNANPK